MPYATSFGPDRILGTKLGEIFRKDGSRKSNKDIFLEDLGWHIEETSGDRVYEWVNTEVTHYTYKLTAADSEKYYYGVRTVKLPNASEEDCLNDGYFGSGGITTNNKLKNWKLSHKDFLRKEIIQRYSRKAMAYEAEKVLIGELWSTDKLCLNSAPGGRIHAPVHNYGNAIVQKKCHIHGLSPHRPGGSCVSCTNSTELKICSIHGETPFQANACAKCKAVKPKLKKCPKHGNTNHRGAVCLSCAAENPGELLCDTHGLPIHKNDYLKRCLGCIANHVGVAKCEIHEEYHRWGSCQSCKLEERDQKLLKLEERKKAKALKHEAKISKKTFTEQLCFIHGRVTFRGSFCVKCQTISTIELKECPTHGLTKHQGEVCAKCSANKSYSTKVCPIHGEVKFSGNSCSSCRAEASVKTIECEIHGTATSVGNRCRLCVNQKAVALKDCSIHGLTKHQGDKCSSCSSMATAHRLHHVKKQNKKCHLCFPR